MRRALLPAVLFALLVAVALMLFSALARPAGAPPAEGNARVEQVDTSAYPTITLYISVDDAAGQPLTGLGSDDFVVTEDGVPVAVAAFGGGAGAVTTALVVDRSGSMKDDAKLDGAKAAAAAFGELMRPGDRAALVAFNEDAALAAAFTADPGELREAIRELRAEGGTALYDAVVAGVELLQDEPGRRLLVVLSDGQDCSASFDSCPSEFGSEHTLDEAIAYALQAGQPVAVVGLGERGGAGRDGIDEAVLEQIAAATGGRYLYAPQAADLAGLYAGLAGAVQQEYRLTYVSPRPSYDGTRRDIEVRSGAHVAGGAYTERHLINVDSSLPVGLVLLAPLALLLALPGVLRKRRAGARAPAPPGGPGPSAAAGRPARAAALAESAAPLAAVPGSGAAGAEVVVTAPAGRDSAVAGARCRSCDAALRPGARFCSSCGATQSVVAAPAAERRTFCDMCGQPLAPGSRFCTGCGEAVTRRREGAAR